MKKFKIVVYAIAVFCMQLLVGCEKVAGFFWR